MIQEKSISAPILEHVYKLLWKGESAADLAMGLMVCSSDFIYLSRLALTVPCEDVADDGGEGRNGVKSLTFGCN